MPIAGCCARRPRWWASHRRRAEEGLCGLLGDAASSSPASACGSAGSLRSSDVSLTARPGRVLGVIGPNGAGKTTLFNVACGFVRPDAGTLAWGGRELRDLRPHQLAGLGIARTLQGLGLFDRMTVLDNVLVGTDAAARAGFLSGLLALPGSAARGGPAARARAGRCSTSSASRRTPTGYPGSLPYAVRKKVALARALVGEPELLMLDEPASGLSDDGDGRARRRWCAD